MHVLGVKTWGHDTGAAILSEIDGEITCTAIAEARLNREKASGRFPVLSIHYCLFAAGLASMDDCDLVVVDRLHENVTPGTRAMNQITFTDDVSIELALRVRWPVGKTHFVNHIDAHAASAYFASPFDDAAILVVEGGTGIYRGAGSRFTPIDRVGYHSISYRDGEKLGERQRPYNISKIYTMTTKALGFGWNGAGKTMGLAAYGHTVPKIDRLNLNREHCLDLFHDQRDFLEAKGPELRKFIEEDPNHLSERRINAARETQEVFVETMLVFAERAKQVTGSRNLALAGGAALSCVANRAIIESGLFEQVFIQPGASDEGVALGCALLGWHHIAGKSARWRMKDAYLGRPYSAREIEEAIASSGCTSTDVTPAEVAKRIANGEVIGRFAGGSEYGPRALGNRSILADPRDPRMRDRINGTIKNREMFRPFAPSCLSDRVDRYFLQ